MVVVVAHFLQLPFQLLYTPAPVLLTPALLTWSALATCNTHWAAPTMHTDLPLLLAMH